MDFIGSYVLNNNSFHKKDDDVFCYFSCLGYYFSDFFRLRASTLFKDLKKLIFQIFIINDIVRNI